MLCSRAKPSDFNFFCKGPERKYNLLYRSFGLCPNYSALPQFHHYTGKAVTDNTYRMCVALFQ